MKKRVFSLLNFLALNILFFAIYLNFIHKDTNVMPAISTAAPAKNLQNNDLKTGVAAMAAKPKMLAEN